MATSDPMLNETLLLLGAAVLAAPVFKKLGLGTVLGYLAAGIVIGPILRLISDPQEVLHVSELGVVFLLFIIGLELKPSRLWQMRGDIFVLGTAQVVISGFVLTGLAWLIGLSSWQGSIIAGFGLALSSTAFALQILADNGEANTAYGRRSFSVLLFQDLAIVPLLALVTLLGAGATETSSFFLDFAVAAAAVGLLVLAGRYLLTPMFQVIARTGAREVMLAAALLVVLGSAIIMQLAGLSMAMGAFLAGVMLAESSYRHELEADVEPFRTILLGLFFLAVGMLLDLQVVMERPFFVIAMAVAVVATKSIVMFGVARLFGVPSRAALSFGLLLSQGGEFAFVLFAQAQGALLIAPEAASLFGAIVTLSMATTPFLMMFSRRFLTPPPTREDRPGPDGSISPAAIIVGYGRFGQTVAQMLLAAGVRITLIDRRVEQIDVAQKFDMKVFYGDGTRIDLLRNAGGADAQAIIFCVDGNGLDKAQLQPILEAFPKAAIMVRAYDRLHMMSLSKLDLAGAVRELFESAVLLGRETLDRLGFSPENVEMIETEYRRRDGLRLEAQIASGDVTVNREMMFSHERSLDLSTEPGEEPNHGTR